MKKWRNSTITHDLLCVWGISTVVLITIVCIVFFSPYSMQFEEKDIQLYADYLNHKELTYHPLPDSEKRIMISEADSILSDKLLDSYSKDHSQYLNSSHIHFGARLSQKDHQAELSLLDSLILNKQKGLSRIPYLDRYLSKTERKEARITRTEIYELQWQRIRCLEEACMEEELIAALKPYKRLIGYHQTEAQKLYRRLTTD